MFNIDMNIRIISDNNKIKDTLNSINKIEDVTLNINNDSNKNLITIYDVRSNINDIIVNNTGYKVLLTTASMLVNYNNLDQFDYIWPMPDNDIYNEKLIKYYLNNLIKEVKEKSDYKHLNICLNTAINSIPNLVWYKDTTGLHLTVNDAFCKATEKTKEDIYKKDHYYIWDIPKVEYDKKDFTCVESEDEILNSKETKLFIEKVETKYGLRLFRTYKSPLIDEDGNIFGTCGIASDITDIENIGKELEMVLESIPFGVVIQDTKGKIISYNSIIKKFFPKITRFGGTYLKRIIDKYVTDEDEQKLIMTIKNFIHDELILEFTEKPIYDVFKNKIGKIGLFRDITLETKYADEINKIANTDQITGLNNRRALYSYLDKNSKVPMYVVSFDLDNFKSVNDTYGHQVGDEALITFSKVLSKTFKNDFVARIGGDEFVLLSKLDKDKLLKQLDYFNSVLRIEFDKRSEFTKLTTSIGVSENNTISELTFKEIINQSDDALYEAKNNGKNKISIYNSKTKRLHL